MDQALNERLEKLESHIAHLEFQYEQLNKAFIDQDKQFNRLLGDMKKMGQTLQGMEADRIRSTNPKPPHYQ